MIQVKAIWWYFPEGSGQSYHEVILDCLWKVMLVLCEETKQFCRWYKTGRSGWQIRWLHSHSKWLWQVGAMGQQRSHEIPEFMACPMQDWGSNFTNPSSLGAGQMECSFPGKIMDILMENKLNMSQQHPLQSGLHFRRVLPAAQRTWPFLSAQPSWDICCAGSSSELPLMRGAGTY